MSKNPTKTFSIEEVGTPYFGYKLPSGVSLEGYLLARSKRYPGIATRLVKPVIKLDAAEAELREIITNAVQDAASEVDPNNQIPIESISVDSLDKNSKVTKWRFSFKKGTSESDFYYHARNICDLIDWDSVMAAVESDFDHAIDGESAWEDYDVFNPNDNASRWLDLYSKGENMGRNDHTMQKGLQFPLDDVINKTFLKMGWKWRGWAKSNGIEPTTEAADFINWVLDNKIDFDSHMQQIGMAIDQSGQVRPELDFDIFNTTTQQQNNTTPMEPIMKAAPQPAAQLIDGSEIATKYQKNFATFMANTSIKDAKRTWTMDGNKAVLTAVEEVRDGYSRISVMTYDTKWKGTSQKTTETEGEVETVLHWRTPSMYQRAIDCNFDMAEMGKLLTEADCKKFGIEFVPTPKDEQSANKGKQTKSVIPTHDSKTAPKSQTIAPSKSEEVLDGSRLEIKSRVTEYYRDSDGRMYTVTPDGSGMCTVNAYAADGSELRSYDMPLEKALSIIVGRCTKITAEEFEGAKPEAKINDAEIEVEQPAPAPEPTPEPTPNPEPEPEPEKVAPTLLLNLPDTILTSEVEHGRMTISGLNDLTAEQVNIFIAGMNAMREAIRKQMKMAE